MRLLKEWRRIDNQRGYVNATTGQNVVVVKKTYGEHYLVMLFPFVRSMLKKVRKYRQNMRLNQKPKHRRGWINIREGWKASERNPDGGDRS